MSKTVRPSHAPVAPPLSKLALMGVRFVEGGDAPAGPPWGSDAEFDAEKAWTLIQNLRGDVDRLKAEKATLAQERDTALGELGQRDKTIEELKATVQLTDDTAKAREQELSQLTTLRAKENLLIDAGLPRDLAPSVVGDDEEAWKSTVERFAALRGEAAQERRPNPAQAATSPAPSADEAAKSFFGLN